MADSVFGTMLETAQGLQGLGINQQKMDLLKQQQQAEMDANQAALERRRAFSDDISAALQDPQQMPAVMLKYPEYADKVGKGISMLDEQTKNRLLNSNASIVQMLDSGNVEGAKQTVQQNIDLYRTMPPAVLSNPKLFRGAVLTQLAADPNGREVIKQLGAAPITPEQTANIALTRAQIAQAEATTRKLGVETQKTAKEISEVGAIDPQKAFQMEGNLRDEYRKDTKDFVSVRGAYERIKASSKTPDAAGDLSLIFGYMKMLDPGSTVREGEFATAQNAGGVSDRVSNIYNKVLSGERLSDSQRKMFLGQAAGLYKAAEKDEKIARAKIMPAIKSYGLNATNVFGDEGQMPDRPDVVGRVGGRPVQQQNLSDAAKRLGISVDELKTRIGVK